MHFNFNIQMAKNFNIIYLNLIESIYLDSTHYSRLDSYCSRDELFAISNIVNDLTFCLQKLFFTKVHCEWLHLFIYLSIGVDKTMFNSSPHLITSPPIHIFSESQYFSAALKTILPEAKWLMSPISELYVHKFQSISSHYIVALTGCTAMEIGSFLSWLKNASVGLNLPILLLVDDFSPLISQLTSEENVVVLSGKINHEKMRGVLLLWLRGTLTHSESIRSSAQLTAKEWGVLSLYLLVRNMDIVANWMDIAKKTAYHHRQSASQKMGFNHFNDFFRYYPVHTHISLLSFNNAK